MITRLLLSGLAMEGAEAAVPFDQPTPVDAYNAALVDRSFYTPPVRTVTVQ